MFLVTFVHNYINKDSFPHSKNISSIAWLLTTVSQNIIQNDFEHEQMKINKWSIAVDIPNNVTQYFAFLLAKCLMFLNDNVKTCLLLTSASLYGTMSFSPTVTVFRVVRASKSISSLTCHDARQVSHFNSSGTSTNRYLALWCMI